MGRGEKREGDRGAGRRAGGRDGSVEGVEVEMEGGGVVGGGGRGKGRRWGWREVEMEGEGLPQWTLSDELSSRYLLSSHTKGRNSLQKDTKFKGQN